MNNQSFVLYESVYAQVSRLEKKLGAEVSYNFLKAVMEFGLYGVLPDEDSDMWLYGLEQTITSITCAKERYAKAVENGAKGGRPRSVDREKVAELKAEGKTNQQVADELNCSLSSVKKINSELKGFGDFNEQAPAPSKKPITTIDLGF